MRVAIVPARGGSKRLPKKNILDFEGRPLLAHTLEAAAASGSFDRLIVSTDSEEIADVARDWGAEVPFLRERYADDRSPAPLATVDALERLELRDGTVAQLMPNCPLRDEEDIRRALGCFDSSDADFQLSCARYGFLNPWWAATLDDGGHPDFLHPEALSSRSQDLPDLFCPTGAIWVAEVSALLRTMTFYGPGHTFFELGWMTAVDIDDEDDLAFARACYRLRRG